MAYSTYSVHIKICQYGTRYYFRTSYRSAMSSSNSSSSSGSSEMVDQDLGAQIAGCRDPLVSGKTFVGDSLFYSVVT